MICKKCGTKMEMQQSVVYASLTPMYGFVCPKCGAVDYSHTPEYNNSLNKNMAMTKQQILGSTQALIQDIDKCTEDYVKASLNHDHVAYEAVFCERSRLLLAAHQQLTALYDYIKEGGDDENRD